MVNKIIKQIIEHEIKNEDKIKSSEVMWNNQNWSIGGKENNFFLKCEVIEVQLNQ